ncbi:MAG: universal stress protein [Thainema sp.]
MQLKSHAHIPAQKGQAISVANIPSTGDGQSSLKPMIMRLETALGRRNLDESLILLSGPPKAPVELFSKTKVTNLVVGYSGSAHSQAALDLALCIAHQTRLVKPDPVVVHVVYVVDQTRPKTIANADRILWQARCLASEWRGSLHAHLRVGHVATELSLVAEEMEADVLLLGCYTSNHALVKKLAAQTPCSVLGLPH